MQSLSYGKGTQQAVLILRRYTARSAYLTAKVHSMLFLSYGKGTQHAVPTVRYLSRSPSLHLIS